ncbi:AbfB domain-containing protein [Actinoplanes sp. NEAU-A12]|uniref:AbfB domain-containing protein n=1 Tax=Actinoplanes sandaracinus TaxID=3045177 RepID=A0ABT6WKR8_9ACTN|nr:AbfB domain-containing protein [Actinoplanes sandaracinus]MDI6100324.1 AbfB domain-containing protein [Actinoplanes sandaracinus]
MTHQVPDPPRPGGTVYGRGGAGAGEDVPARLPRAVPITVGIGIVAVLALGYAAWSSTGGDGDEPSAAVAAPVSSAAGSRAPAGGGAGTGSPSPAPASLATGTWLLSPLGDLDTYLTVNGDFAKMSPADPVTLTVVTGLADDTCFSFRVDEDRYLRHFDYRLRADESDDSDLFRADATFCQEAGAGAGTVRLRSKNYPDYALHRRDDDSLHIDKPAGAADGFSFMVQPGG